MTRTFARLLCLAATCAACTPTEKPGATGPAGRLAGPPLPDTTAPRPVARPALPAPPRADTLHLTSDDFVSKALEALQYKRVILRRAAFQLSSTVAASEEAPVVQDSLNNFTDEQENSFTYYTSGDKQAPGASLREAVLRSSATHLPRQVRVGMSQAEFARAFQRQAVPAVVVVTEAEGYQVFTFTFAGGALVSIRFVSNYSG